MNREVESITLIKQNHEVIKDLKQELYVANDRISAIMN